MLSIFGVSSTGVNFYRSSLDAIAHNVSNLNTVRARDELAVQRQVVVGSANESPAPGVVGAGGVVGSGVSFRVAHGSSTDDGHFLDVFDDGDSVTAHLWISLPRGSVPLRKC